MPYPAAPRGDVVDVLHGESVPDPYRWLEDPEDPRTTAWTSAQAELWEQHAEQWSTRPAFRDRVAQLLRTGSVGTPVWRGGRCLHTRRGPDDEHAVLLRCMGHRHHGLRTDRVDGLAARRTHQ